MHPIRRELLPTGCWPARGRKTLRASLEGVADFFRHQSEERRVDLAGGMARVNGKGWVRHAESVVVVKTRSTMVVFIVRGLLKTKDKKLLRGIKVKNVGEIEPASRSKLVRRNNRPVRERQREIG